MPSSLPFHRPFSKFLFVLWAAFTVVSSALWAQQDGAPAEPLFADSFGLVELDWRLEAADAALREGLAHTAEREYEQILRSPLSIEQRNEVVLRLTASLISQRRFQRGRASLEKIDEASRDGRFFLYSAVLSYGDGRDVNAEALSAALSQVDAAELEAAELPWLHVMRGLEATLAGDSELAEKEFAVAAKSASTGAQRAFFEGLVLRERILAAPADESLAVEVRLQLDRLEGEAAAFTFAREYAAILFQLGRPEEAIRAIDRELANTEAQYSSREREQLLLMKGIILGGGSVSGRAALRELLRSGKSREVMAVALQVLAREQDELGVAELEEFLNEMIARPEPHPLLGQFYFMRSQLALRASPEPNYELAEQDASLLLEQFPGLSQITSVYRLLAYAALQREPAQYRVAADYLIQLRDETESSIDRAMIDRMIGDCYFLNSDYSNAADFYRASRVSGVSAAFERSLFLRIVSAEIRSGDVGAAVAFIDEADFSAPIGPAERWRAEWNVAQELRARGANEEALERVRGLLAEGATGAVPAMLDLRLRWMEAYLSLLTEPGPEVVDRIGAVLDRVRSMPAASEDDFELRRLVSELLLLRAQVQMREGETSAGEELIAEIRTGYPESPAAERSYLVEANYHESIGDFEAAQRTLTELAERYPESDLAPYALFEAAIYCERRGAENFGEAIRLHDLLAERYPDDPVIFEARLKQGNLLRSLNDFSGALIVYENLVNGYPQHPRRFVAELSMADCILALARDDARRLEEASLVFDRLLDLSDVPADFQAEIGYKCAFVLDQRGLPEEAAEVRLLTASRFLLDDDSESPFGPTGRYWISRVLFRIAETHEAEGELSETRRLYRKVVAFNLPGRNLAQQRLDALGVSEE